MIDVDNSNLSGSLTFTNIENKDDIIQMSNQCTNIDPINIYGSTDDNMVFWQGMNDILIKNGAWILFGQTGRDEIEGSQRAFKLINKNNLTIHQMECTSVDTVFAVNKRIYIG